MLEHNKQMQKFLKENGIDAIPKYIFKGSLKHSWRLYGINGDGWNGYQKWTENLYNKLNELGFISIHGRPLGQFDGNGGIFSIFVRGHNEFLKEA